MDSRQFNEAIQRLELGTLEPGCLELIRLGEIAREWLPDTMRLLEAYQRGYKRKCRDIAVLRARIRTLEQRVKKLDERRSIMLEELRKIVKEFDGEVVLTVSKDQETVGFKKYDGVFWVGDYEILEKDSNVPEAARRVAEIVVKDIETRNAGK